METDILLVLGNQLCKWHIFTYFFFSSSSSCTLNAIMDGFRLGLHLFSTLINSFMASSFDMSPNVSHAALLIEYRLIKIFATYRFLFCACSKIFILNTLYNCSLHKKYKTGTLEGIASYFQQDWTGWLKQDSTLLASLYCLQQAVAKA